MHIARDDRMFRADGNTRRLQPDLDAMGTIVALGSRLTVGINVERVIGARLHARLTANTAARVEIDDAIAALKESPSRTNSDTGGISAVIAAVNKKIAPRIGKLALLDVLYPRAVNPDRNIVFGLTSHGTGMTADAFALVNNKGVFHK